MRSRGSRERYAEARRPEAPGHWVQHGAPVTANVETLAACMVVGIGVIIFWALVIDALGPKR